MNKIILLTGSRNGSHYLCNMFYDTLGVPLVMPELLNHEHWDIEFKSKKKNLSNLQQKFDLVKGSMKYILDNSDDYIIKYCDFYDKFSAQEIIDLGKQHNAKFYYLYRESVLDTFISYIIVEKYGYLDKPQKMFVEDVKLEKAAALTIYNYESLIDLYNKFDNCIDGMIKYEDFKNTSEDLKLLGIKSKNVVISTQKIVTDKIKNKILKQHNLSEYLRAYIENSLYYENHYVNKYIDNDWNFTPIKTN